jgi:hypothetical protein
LKWREVDIGMGRGIGDDCFLVVDRINSGQCSRELVRCAFWMEERK